MQIVLLLEESHKLLLAKWPDSAARSSGTARLVASYSIRSVDRVEGGALERSRYFGLNFVLEGQNCDEILMALERLI